MQLTVLEVTLVAALSVGSLSYLIFKKASRYPHPPGPRGWPLIGNLLDAPKPGKEWIAYREMCKKYGL